jgi:predicted nucleic acid-binding protein
MPYLADVNFLIALLHPGHQHSPQAVALLDRQDDAASIHLCRVAQMGVLRILTHPGLMKADVQSAASVWQAWDLLLTDDRFLQVEEPQRLEETWRGLTRNFP